MSMSLNTDSDSNPNPGPFALGSYERFVWKAFEIFRTLHLAPCFVCACHFNCNCNAGRRRTSTVPVCGYAPVSFGSFEALKVKIPSAKNKQIGKKNEPLRILPFAAFSKFEQRSLEIVSVIQRLLSCKINNCE